jgi:malate dehydrogenase (oxaloacetate-decarboxylating)(NADP+)
MFDGQTARGNKPVIPDPAFPARQLPARLRLLCQRATRRRAATERAQQQRDQQARGRRNPGDKPQSISFQTRRQVMSITKQEALNYHALPQPGKIEITPTKPCRTQRDLSLAYTPGVAEPCLAIQKTPHDAFKYTGRGNLVAVVTNGTAVLGLGDIGALAGKPVMEGKAVLFKRFAGVNVYDIEVNTKNPDEIIRVCQLLEPTFGGINLEDIKAPECFYIEETLKKTMKIPVFHDDQHGTAIITGAALLNALEITGKDISKIKVVFNGAGAAGIATAEHYIRLGVKRENI